MKNTVELILSVGGDKSHALSAWTSTSRELTPEKLARIPTLLLKMREGDHGESHRTPFEKSYLQFLITTDIATHIHLIKHRIAVSVNAESARYKELREDKYYIPEDWPDEWQRKLEDHCRQSFELYHACLTDLVSQGLSRKRAKESARYFNPYATQITADVAFNFSSFIHFCNLRVFAQREIAAITKEMIRAVMALENDPFHHSIRVWGLDKYVDDSNSNAN